MRVFRVVFLFSLILAGAMAYARPATIQAAAPLAPLTANPAKFGITQEGIYRVSASDLATQFDLTNVNPSQLELTNLAAVDPNQQPTGQAVMGQPVPIFVSSTGSTFSGSDYIEFYAHPVNNTYTATNVYVLYANVASSVASAARVTTGSLGTSQTPSSNGNGLYQDLHRKASDYRQANTCSSCSPYTVSTAWPSDGDLRFDDGTTYSSPTYNIPTVNFALPLQNAVSTTTNDCSLTAQVSGQEYGGPGPYTYQVDLSISDTTSSNPSHPVPGDPFVWNQTNTAVFAPNTVSTPFPCNYLTDGSGSKQVTMTQTLTSGTTTGAVYLFALDVNYLKQLCAQNSQVIWTTPTGQATTGKDGYTVSGFNANDPVTIWAVTGSGATRYTAPASSVGGSCASTNGVTFADPSFTTAKTFVATSAPFTVSSNPAAISITPLDTTDLTMGVGTGTQILAQYLIISAPQFFSGAESNCTTSAASSQPLCQLAAYHHLAANGGYSTQVVNLTTIYDQFAGGQINPEAIRKYISYAQAHLGTQYVVLAGGDTQDYHNYAGCVAPPLASSCTYYTQNPYNQSYIPYLYDNGQFYGVTPTDTLYAIAENAPSPVPDVSIGRLPAFITNPNNPLAQLQTEINRSMSWVAQVNGNGTPSASYAGTAAFAADYPKPDEPANQFSDASNALIAKLPPSFTKVQKFYFDGVATDDSTLKSNFVATISSGQEIVNYIGHGNIGVLGHGDPVFTYQDAQAVTNVNRLSLVALLGCTTANIVNPAGKNSDMPLLTGVDSNNSPKGAVLAVGSNGQDLADPQTALASSFYGHLANGDTVGLAMMKAKNELYQAGNQSTQDVINSYEILGDPALTLPNSKPTLAHVSHFQAAASHHGVTLNWKAVTGQQIAGYRVQRHTATNGYTTISRVLTVNHYLDLRGHSGDLYRLQVIGRHGEVLSTTLTRAR